MVNRRAAILSVTFATLVTMLLYSAMSVLGLGSSTARVFQRGTVLAPQVNFAKGSSLKSDQEEHTRTLGIASQIFVVSLPSRNDRREQTRLLFSALGLRWSYVDAVSLLSVEVDIIMHTLRRRRGFVKKPTFRWPKDINAIASTTGPIARTGSELWVGSDNESSTRLQNASLSRNSSDSSLASEMPLTCATEDETIPDHTPNLPPNKILTNAKVAVWKSHFSVIRKVAEDTSTDINIYGEHVSLILEDDVDMEWDIRERILSVWSLLPDGWDVVFLGEHTRSCLEY